MFGTFALSLATYSVSGASERVCVRAPVSVFGQTRACAPSLKSFLPQPRNVQHVSAPHNTTPRAHPAATRKKRPLPPPSARSALVCPAHTHTQFTHPHTRKYSEVYNTHARTHRSVCAPGVLSIRPARNRNHTGRRPRASTRRCGCCCWSCLCRAALSGSHFLPTFDGVNVCDCVCMRVYVCTCVFNSATFCVVGVLVCASAHCSRLKFSSAFVSGSLKVCMCVLVCACLSECARTQVFFVHVRTAKQRNCCVRAFDNFQSYSRK